MIALLERVLAWLERRSGAFPFDGAGVVQHGGSWLRIEPGRPARWYPSEMEASRG